MHDPRIARRLGIELSKRVGTLGPAGAALAEGGITVMDFIVSYLAELLAVLTLALATAGVALLRRRRSTPRREPRIRFLGDVDLDE